MANNNQIYKFSNAGGFKSLNRYYDMLAGNTTWNPWEPDGAYDSLATVTVPSGGLASIEFAAIPNTYKHLQIRMMALTTASTIQPQMRFNSDAGTNYSRHSLYGDGGLAAAYGQASVNQLIIGGLAVGMNSTNPYVCVIDILDYSSSLKNKTMRSLSGTDRNGTGEIGLHSGVWLNTAPVTSVSVISSGTYAQYTQISLYGVK